MCIRTKRITNEHQPVYCHHKCGGCRWYIDLQVSQLGNNQFGTSLEYVLFRVDSASSLEFSDSSCQETTGIVLSCDHQSQSAFYRQWPSRPFGVRLNYTAVVIWWRIWSMTVKDLRSLKISISALHRLDLCAIVGFGPISWRTRTPRSCPPNPPAITGNPCECIIWIQTNSTTRNPMQKLSEKPISLVILPSPLEAYRTHCRWLLGLGYAIQ